MPRININEKDRTAPGISSEYANFAVLITGFEGFENIQSGRLAEKDRPVKPDSNGVYEFITAADFKETIGLRAPKLLLDGEDIVTYNYGNQMAYELLNQGYPIIYKPIKSQTELLDTRTWEIFKDKVSYDFRFITHGLLNSDPDVMQDNSNRQLLAAKRKLIEIISETFVETDATLNSSLCPDYTSTLNVVLKTKKETINAVEQLVADTIIEYDPANHAAKSYYLESSIISKEAVKAKMNLASTPEADRAATAETWWNLLETAISNAYTESINAGTYVDQAFKEYIDQNKDNGSIQSFEYYWNDLGLKIAEKCAYKNEVISTESINAVNKLIADLAAYKTASISSGDEDAPAPDSGRGDCIALIELDENTYVNSISNKKPEALIRDAILATSFITEANGAYCALTVPSVYYTSLENKVTSVWGGNNKMPGAFHYLACFIKSLGQGYAEWYAAAGYTRGVANLTIDHTSVRLGEIAINTLEPRNKATTSDLPFACNVIASFRGSYYLWGNRTAYPLGVVDGDRGDLVASHFLNIRQLSTTIKKTLFNACRKFTFDPNSDTLWINFCNAIRPTLETMKADQGIRDYRIVKVATPKKATLKAKIRIIPIEAVEDFVLEVSLEDAFGETTATVVG
jgi:hypothetical protein